ncbi:MAG TPA: basic secretory protein-like protein [Planctomycetota bacterium]|nr:basic secretory protein-like protein [Planctomycetota bacterium]
MLQRLVLSAIILYSAAAWCAEADAIPAPKLKVSALIFTDVGELDFEPAPTSEWTLRYTIDGWTPTAKSPAICGPFRVGLSLPLTVAYVRPDGKVGEPLLIECARHEPPEAADLEPGILTAASSGPFEKLPAISTLSKATITKGEPRFAPQPKGALTHQSGFLQIAKEGVYRFQISGDGPRELRIAGARVVNATDSNSFMLTKEGRVKLAPGFYSFQAAWISIGSPEVPVVSIEGPDFALQKIPSNLLFRNRFHLPVSGASIQSTLPTFKQNTSDLAIDGNEGTWYWGNKAAKADDAFTVTFSEPRKLSSLEALTGKPDGDNRLDHGVLEISSDGKSWREVGKFLKGVARADFQEEAVQAVRIRVTAQTGGWLAIREIAINKKRAPPPEKFSAAINVDYSETPDLKEWAERALKDADEQFPVIAERLKSEGYTPPRQITLFFRKDMKGIAHAIGSKIEFAEGWIKAHPNDTGTVIHELTHVIQGYTHANNPGWLVEGIADYVRWFNWEPLARRPKINPLKAKYSNSYQDSAAFLVWAEKTYDKELVCKLNKHMREGSYDSSLFQKFTGRDLEALGSEFSASLKSKAD